MLGSLIEPIQRLWSGKAKNPVAYEVTLSVADDQGGLKDALEEASALVAESAEGAPSSQSLLALAREEPARLTAALYQEGYYSGRIAVTIAGQPVDDPAIDIALPEQGKIPVAIAVTPGPLFHFGPIRIAYADGTAPADDDAGIAEAVGLKTGAVAKSRAVLAAGSRIVNVWKDRGYAFAKVVSRDVTADHAARTVEAAFTIDRGRPAQFGAIEVKGAERFEAELLLSRADLHEGEPYSPEALKAARKRLAKLDGLRGVRIVEAGEPDANGRIPLVLDVTERERRYIGANAAVSSVDGAEIGAYWGHRNVFGGGESLRIEGAVSNLGGDAGDGLEYDAKISLTRPSIADAYTDYRTSLAFKHEEPDSYESDEAALHFGVTHQFDPTLTGEAGINGSWIETDDDVFGANTFSCSVCKANLCPIRETIRSMRRAADARRCPPNRLLIFYNSTAFVKARTQLSGYARSAPSRGSSPSSIGSRTRQGGEPEWVVMSGGTHRARGGEERARGHRVQHYDLDARGGRRTSISA
ncbi:MAG: hypothetical protein HC850_06700 [Rhodomicrobium sp.]|nr:hypothetical protein [Rhodomicrobium sp.]